MDLISGGSDFYNTVKTNGFTEEFMHYIHKLNYLDLIYPNINQALSNLVSFIS